jgi:large subunit ribosomal protein L7e
MHDLHSNPKNVLQLLRLRKVNDAMFIQINKTVISLLKVAEPYVAWG